MDEPFPVGTPHDCRSEAAPAALLQVAEQAARTASPAALPVLLHQLVASEWPVAPVLAVWSTLLGSAPVGEAVATSSQLAAEPGKMQPSSKQSRPSRQQNAATLGRLAAALLDHAEGDANESLAQASGVFALGLTGAGSRALLADLHHAISCSAPVQALAAHDIAATTACLLARVQLARGGAATTAWHLLSACLPAAFQAEPETVAAVVTRMFEQGEYKQVRALLGM